MNLKNTFAYRSLAAVKRSLQIIRTVSHEQGFLKSVLSGKPIGPHDEAIPWFTYPAIEYLKQFDFSDKIVFEYGSGNSSVFWAQRAKEVIAVESDRKWFEYVSKIRSPNLLLMLEEKKEAYASSIARSGKMFDVIVIDGRWRNACTVACVDFLSSHGMIIFDNSDRHYDGCNDLRNRGFFQVDFNGWGPVNGYCWTTSIFIRASTTLQHGFSAASPVGGIILAPPA